MTFWGKNYLDVYFSLSAKNVEVDGDQNYANYI